MYLYMVLYHKLVHAKIADRSPQNAPDFLIVLPSVTDQRSKTALKLGAVRGPAYLVRQNLLYPEIVLPKA